ncbi:MAG TPA: PIN domain-containing protein [Prosthecobacter sp.]|nr:PIN domain-containing protein [Prosthecobacter sp.]
MPATPAYLLDSSACIPILRNQAGLGKLPSPAKSGIPIIVAAELWTGVKKNMGSHPQQAAKLQAFLDLFVIPAFDMEAAVHYAEIRADLETRGKTIGPLDLLIAAQARSLGATLVTGNASEFKRVKGLKVQEWHPAA